MTGLFFMGKHRDARAFKGDRQAGQITRTTKIVESGQDYKASVRGGVPYADGKRWLDLTHQQHIM